ncbi:MAG: BrnA antitoxin family protein [Chloroflexota bacterium]|nr:BrnA antitoxin family protein [Chloroflexota bacterium]
MNDKLPTFTNYEEEAAFWDTHSVTDFLVEAAPVEVKVAKPLEHVVPVRFDARTVEQLRSIATARGIGPTTLIRMWVMERLGQMQSGRTSQGPAMAKSIHDQSSSRSHQSGTTSDRGTTELLERGKE